MKYNVAISFRGKERREYARKLAQVLIDKYKLSVWIDEIDEKLPYNFNSTNHLASVFQKSQYIVVLYSKEYGETFFTNFENLNLFYGTKNLFIIIEDKFKKDLENRFPQYIYEPYGNIEDNAYNFINKFTPKFFNYKIELKKDFFENKLYNSNYTLNDIYINLRFDIYSKNIKDFTNFKSEKKRFLSNEKLNFLFLTHQTKTIEEFLIEVFDNKNNEINETNLILLFGHPGAGKSSLLKKLYLQYKNKDIIFIRLRDIISVEDGLNTFNVNPTGIIKKYLEQIEYYQDLSNKIILLDGLDEYIMLSKDTLNSLHNYTFHILNDLLYFAYNNNTLFVVSTRFGYFDFNGIEEFLNSNKIYKNKLSIFKLKEFNSKQISKFLDKMKVKKSKKNRIFQLIKKDYKIKELLQQPILLFLIITFNLSFQKSLKRAEIYQKIFNEIIKRKWDKSDFSLYVSEILNKIGYENILKLIASNLEFNKKLLLKEKEIIALLNNYLNKKYNFSESELKELFSDILVAFYFKETHQNKEMALEFLHRSFQEFFSAKYLVENLIQIIKNKDKQRLINFVNKNLRFILSYDVRSFIKEMFSSSNINNKFLLKSFSEILKNDFFTTDNISNTIAKFYNLYWLFHLKNDVSLINKKDISQKFGFYFNIFNIHIQNNFFEKENLFFNKNIIKILNESFIEAEMINIYKNIIFKNCHFDKVFFSGQIHNSIFIKCKFDYINSMELNIKFSNFEDIDFNYINLNTTYFRKCKFKNCKFVGSLLFQVSFVDCVFENVEFDEICSLEQILFKRCKGNINTNRHNAKFIQCNLKRQNECTF